MIETYRTVDGRDYFLFRFERRPRVIRIYVLKQPSYGARPEDGHSTHRYVDEHGQHYICWDGSCRDMQEAHQVAKAWAERTQQYVRTGRRF